MLYAANHTGEIYSLHDTDGDGLEDHAALFCDVKEEGLRAPAGMVFKGQDLYVGTAQEVRIYTDLDGDQKADTSRTFYGNLPHSEHPFVWKLATSIQQLASKVMLILQSKGHKLMFYFTIS